MRHQLAVFCRQYDVQGGEFTQSRVRTYDQTQRMILLNVRSNIKSDGLAALFYTRYFTYTHLSLLEQQQQQPNLIAPSAFYHMMQEELAFCQETTMESDVLVRDSYHIVLTRLRGRRYADAIVADEINTRRAIDADDALYDQFNALNREASLRANALLCHDIRHLTPTPQRIAESLTRNGPVLLTMCVFVCCLIPFYDLFPIV